MTRRAPATPLAAYMLHRWDWSESSLIVDLFTRERGRVAAAAKGAKRPTSQLRPVLLPFQRLHAVLGRTPEGESDLHVLRSADWAPAAADGIAPVPPLAGSALLRGFYLNELLLALLARQDPHPGLFDAYAQTLATLAARHGVGDDGAGAAALRAFELVLLRETGVLPDLAKATLTRTPLTADARYALHPEAGVVEAPAAAAAALTGALLEALESALAARDLGRLQRACARAPQPLRTQLRALLHYHLGSRPLRTRQVMVELQRLLPGTTRPARPARDDAAAIPEAAPERP
jgi:DNA repair protein RecO (recombination protein O)